MNNQEMIGGAGGVGARSERLQRELAAARRALARPTSPVDEVLDEVAAQLLSEFARDAAPTGRDEATGEEESPVVCVQRRISHPLHN